MAKILFLVVIMGLVGQQPQSPNPQNLVLYLHYLGTVGSPTEWDILLKVASLHSLRQERRNQEFWEAMQPAQSGAAAELILAQNPFTVAILRLQARNFSVWHEPAFAQEKAPDLTPEWLDLIRDSTTMPNFRGRAPDERRPDEVAAYNLFCQAVLYSFLTPLDAFVNSAQENSHVTFGHLWNESSKFRGKVIPIQGQLLRVRRMDAPNKLLDHGIKEVYEGWIKGPTKGSNPFVVIFPIPPEDKSSPTGVLEPAETMDRFVTFYGYYFKKFRYPVEIGTGPQKKNMDRDSPMLIGPTLILPPTPPPVTPEGKAFPMSSQLVIALVGFGVFVVCLLIGLTFWFRRGDRQFHRRMRDLHTAQAMEMIENAGKEPTEPDPTQDQNPPLPN